MKKISISSFITISILSSTLYSFTFRNNSGKNLPTKATHTPLDTSIIAILPYDTVKHFWIFPVGKKTELTANDLLIIDSLLLKCITEYNPGQEKIFNEIISKHPDYPYGIESHTILLKRYKRQYIAVKNRGEETEVWINCFCNNFDWSSKDYWRRERILVHDGGNCYFNLKMNLTQNLYYDLMVNGSP